MRAAILTDFGSTFTKVVVVDMDKGTILLSDRFHSTVSTDAGIALRQCFAAARSVLPAAAYENAVKLSTSSAAGGLRMVVVGLSHTLSVTAGRNAAFGAGAKILKTVTGKLTPEDIDAIEKTHCEILLFCGGYENGSRKIVLENARMLADSNIMCPVIYAGNSEVSRDVRVLFMRGNKECFIVPNIIPEIGVLNTGPTEEIIRNVFLKRIINMKGLDKIAKDVDAVIMPTPAAVLKAGELLSRGTEKEAGLGSLMIVDIGGATTDIHSYGESESFEGAHKVGVDEPYAKRTVEGDLGMRESSGSLVQEIGIEHVARNLGVTQELILESVRKRTEDIRFLADSAYEEEMEVQIASGAAYLAARRHAGVIQNVLSKGVNRIQIGKNIRSVATIIGTGGPIIHNRCRKEILQSTLLREEERETLLLPEQADFYVDEAYCFYAAGLLCTVDPDLALRVMKQSIRTL